MNKMIYTLPGQIQSFGVWILGASILLVCTAILSASRLPEDPRQKVNLPVPVSAIASSDWNFVAYPNPAHGLVNIEWSGPAMGNVIPVEVVAVTGSEEFTIFLPTEEYIQQLNVTDWPAGTYRLRIGSGDMQATREIVIE